MSEKKIIKSRDHLCTFKIMEVHEIGTSKMNIEKKNA